MRFFTSDLHFLHNKIRFYCKESRGHFRNIEEHDNMIIKTNNLIVKNSDDLWILGDLIWGGSDKLKTYLSKMNGKKHLIIGNHDPLPWRDYIECGFESVQRYAVLKSEKYGAFGLTHDPSVAIVDTSIPWLCGHLHHQFLRMGNAINVGLDVRGFVPVSEEQLDEDFNITINYNMNPKRIDQIAKKEILGIE